MFAKLGGRKWKGGEIPKTLSKYFALLDFGCNAPKTYGKAEDKPVWWPKNPKWKNFRNPSKASKEECTLLITLFLEGEMYENPSNCNAEHETDDESFGQDERRRRKNYVMI